MNFEFREEPETIIGPQRGPQTAFLSSSADICLYGGSAGGGKTFSLLLEPLRHIENPQFGAVCFRRTSKQVRLKGGLWDESQKLYPAIGGIPRPSNLDWYFPSGATLAFAHLEHEKDKYDYQGSQIPLLLFDELTHFSESQFFYMLSRNRSTSGIPGYVRATCNPDADSWVRELIDWWIDEEGYAIPERSGRLRWFARIMDNLEWADTPGELKKRFGADVEPKSLTFIPAKLADNAILMEKDPSYRSNLKALSKIDRERLLGDEQKGGNWNIRPAAGVLFNQAWFPMVDVVPPGHINAVRFWDRAATKPHPDNKDPDWTRGILLLEYADGTYCVADMQSLRDSPGRVEVLIQKTAKLDGVSVRIAVQQDPGSAGVSEAEYFMTLLRGYDVHTRPFFKDKVTRAKPVSAQSEFHRVKVLRAPWNKPFFKELVEFPEGGHDDIVDAFSGAFSEFSEMRSITDLLRRRA